MRTPRPQDSFLRDAARALGLRARRRSAATLVGASLLAAAVVPLAVIAAPPAPPSVEFSDFALGTAVGTLTSPLDVSSDQALSLDVLHPNAWSTATTVSSTPPASFEALVGDERMLVTSSGGSFTVTERGRAGTSAAAHAAGAVVYRLWPDGTPPLLTRTNETYGVRVASRLTVVGLGTSSSAPTISSTAWAAYDPDADPGTSAAAPECLFSYKVGKSTFTEFRTVNQKRTWTRVASGFDSQEVTVTLPGASASVVEPVDGAAVFTGTIPAAALGGDGLVSLDVEAQVSQREFRRTLTVDEYRYWGGGNKYCWPNGSTADLTSTDVVFTQDEQQIVRLTGLDRPGNEVQSVDLDGLLTLAVNEQQRIQLSGLSAGTNEVQTASEMTSFVGAKREVQTVTLTDFTRGTREVQQMTLSSLDNNDTYQLRWNGGTPNANVLKRGSSLSGAQVAHNAANVKTVIDALLADNGILATVEVSSFGNSGYTITYSGGGNISEHLEVVNGTGGVTGTLSQTTQGVASDSFTLRYNTIDSQAITSVAESQTAFETAIAAAISAIPGAPTPTSVAATGFVSGGIGGFAVTFAGAADPLSVTNGVGVSGSVAITEDGRDSDVLQLTYGGGTAFPAGGIRMVAGASGTVASVAAAIQAAVRTETSTLATVAATGTDATASTAGTISGFTVTFPTFDAAQLAFSGAAFGGSLTTTTPGATGSAFLLRVTIGSGAYAGTKVTAALGSTSGTATAIRSALEAALDGSNSVTTTGTSTAGATADVTVTFGGNGYAGESISAVEVCGVATTTTGACTTPQGVTATVTTVADGKPASRVRVGLDGSWSSPLTFGGAGGSALNSSNLDSALEDLPVIVSVTDVTVDASGFRFVVTDPSNTNVAAVGVQCLACAADGTDVTLATRALRDGGAATAESFKLRFDVDAPGGPVIERQTVTFSDLDGADRFRLRFAGTTAATVFGPDFVLDDVEGALEALLPAGATVTATELPLPAVGFDLEFGGTVLHQDLALIGIYRVAGDFGYEVEEAAKGGRSARTTAAIAGGILSEAACVLSACTTAAAAAPIDTALSDLFPYDESNASGTALNVDVTGVRTQPSVDELQLVALTDFDGSDAFTLGLAGSPSVPIVRGVNYTRSGVASALSTALGEGASVTVLPVVDDAGSPACGSPADALTDAGFCVRVGGRPSGSEDLDDLVVTTSSGAFTSSVTEVARGTGTFDQFTVSFRDPFASTDFEPLEVIADGSASFTAEVIESVKGTRGRPRVEFLDSTDLPPVRKTVSIQADLLAPTFDKTATFADPLLEASPGGSFTLNLESRDGTVGLDVDVVVSAFADDGAGAAAWDPEGVEWARFGGTYGGNASNPVLNVVGEVPVACDVAPGDYLITASIEADGEGLGDDRMGIPFTAPAPTTIGVISVVPGYGVDVNGAIYGATIDPVTGLAGFQNLYGTGGFASTLAGSKRRTIVNTTPGSFHVTAFSSTLGTCEGDDPAVVDFAAPRPEVQLVTLPDAFGKAGDDFFRLHLDRSDDGDGRFGDDLPDWSEPIRADAFTRSAIERAIEGIGDDASAPAVDEVQEIVIQNFAECDAFTIALPGEESITVRWVDESAGCGTPGPGEVAYADEDIEDALEAGAELDPDSVEVTGFSPAGFVLTFANELGGQDVGDVDVACPELCEPSVEEVVKGAPARSEDRRALDVTVFDVTLDGDGYSFRVAFPAETVEVPLLWAFEGRDSEGVYKSFNDDVTVTRESSRDEGESFDLVLEAPPGFDFVKTGSGITKVYVGPMEDEGFDYNDPGSSLKNVVPQLTKAAGTTLETRTVEGGTVRISVRLDRLDPRWIDPTVDLAVGQMPAEWRIFVFARVTYVGTARPATCQLFPFEAVGSVDDLVALGANVGPSSDTADVPLRHAGGEPYVVSASLPVAFSGQSYSAPLDTRFGSGSYGFSAVGLPDGLDIDPATGRISGETTAVGIHVVTITVTDAGMAACGSSTRTMMLEVVD